MTVMSDASARELMDFYLDEDFRCVHGHDFFRSMQDQNSNFALCLEVYLDKDSNIRTLYM